MFDKTTVSEIELLEQGGGWLEQTTLERVSLDQYEFTALINDKCLIEYS